MRLWIKITQIFRTLYNNPDANRAVKESESMADLVGKLLPVAIGLAVAGTLVAGSKVKKWES